MKEKSVFYFYPRNEPYSFCWATVKILDRMGLLKGHQSFPVLEEKIEDVRVVGAIEPGDTVLIFGGSTQIPMLCDTKYQRDSVRSMYENKGIKTICICTEQETNAPYSCYEARGKDARDAYSHFVYFNRADEHLYKDVRSMYSLPWVDEKEACFRKTEWKDRLKQIVFIGKLENNECYSKRFELWENLDNADLIATPVCPYSDTEFTAFQDYNDYAITIDLPGSGSGPSIRAFEAAACGMALILKEGESRAIFGDVAFYYDPEDYEGLKKLIETMDWDEAELKAQKSWELMHNEYSAERTMQKILDWAEL